MRKDEFPLIDKYVDQEINRVLEDIKADIELARYGLINDGLDVALTIINKHMKGDQRSE